MTDEYLCRLLGPKLYDFNNKERNMTDYIIYMLNRCQAMFRYENLPAEIPARDLELMLQTNGWICFTDKPDGKLRIFTGGLGGPPDYLYHPTLCTIANPALSFSASLKIDEECIIMPNDSMFYGLMQIHRRYSSMLIENDISLRLNNINSRATVIISADDDKTAESASRYMEQLYDGDEAIVAETPFLEGIKVSPFTHSAVSQNITALMQYEQYLKTAWFNELGLDSNMHDMKSQYISEDELQISGDALLPLIDDMLRCRMRAIKKINEMYGTEIEVSLNSAWEDNQQQQNNITFDYDGDGDADEAIEPESGDTPDKSAATESPEQDETAVVDKQLDDDNTISDVIREEVENENVDESEVEEKEGEKDESET